jgi:hypothetical protein
LVVYPLVEWWLAESFDKRKKDRYVMIYSSMMQHKACSSKKSILYYKYKDWADHFVPNGFWKYSDRTNENLRHIRWMVFDFELRRSNGKKFYPNEVYEIFTQNGFEPSFVVQSKTPGNYHVYLAHTEITGHTASIYLHNRIQKYISSSICEDIRGVGAAIGPAHSFRLPKHDKIWFFDLNILDIDDLKERWIHQVEKEIEKTKKHQKILSFKEEQVWRHEAIQKLLNAEFNGSRNHASFTIALLYIKSGLKRSCFLFLSKFIKYLNK